MKWIASAIVGLTLIIGAAPTWACPNGSHAEQKEKQKMESYTGKVEPMGMSMFMQGSHQLVDDKGNMIVILSAGDGIDLNKYTNKKVKVSGTTADTVEAGGKIMTVSKVEDL